MASSPVQVILNSNDFIEQLENQRGGASKDFFAGSDEDFEEHRQHLQQQLAEIKHIQMVNSTARMLFGKVTLQPAALAKSHRPTKKLFRNDVAPVVGAGDLGELFVELTPEAIDEINRNVAQAEAFTRYKEDKDGRLIPNPSRARSEVGAIQEITVYGESDKRKFSVNEAVEWLSQSQTGGGYIVELFEAPPAERDLVALSRDKLNLFTSLIYGLQQLGNGLVATRIRNSAAAVSFSVKLEQSASAPVVQLQQPITTPERKTVSEINLNVDRHSALLDFLGKHPLVKKVTLPPIITQSAATSTVQRARAVNIGAPVKGKFYPKIGVVDGGVSDVYGEWVEKRLNYVSSKDKDESHGTFIAGLSIIGQALNGSDICKEADGCKIIDLDIFPKHNFRTYFPNALQFFDALETAVRELKEETGVRIFNFSLNIEEHASTTGYSLTARIMDRIAEENDVIFVISAGNTKPHDARKEWPEDKVEALKILANSRNDTIKTPAESCRNLSVSALNPGHLDGIVPYALSNYSCRGPGLRSGLKPDLAHIGGSGTKHAILGHGLLSLDPTGKVADACGTSYATPHVSKTLACLEHGIEGEVTRETLMALAIHHAVLPPCLTDKDLKSITKHLVGFGIPGGSTEILNGNPNAITLVFANRAIGGHKMSFKFSWPSSLVKDGKCVGYAKLTIVSTPRLDYRYGAEFVRINIEASLRQLQKDGGYLGRLQAIYTPDDDGSQYEKDQIEHGFKWSPVKVYEKTFKGVGPTTEWSLDVEYLARDGVTLPAVGVPFTAILTIGDHKKKAPVFADMRKTLQARGVQVVDLQTAARIKPRI